MNFCEMVGNLTHWRTSHVQIIQDIFYSFECPYPSYLMLQLANVLLSIDMAQSLICNDHDLKRSRS